MSRLHSHIIRFSIIVVILLLILLMTGFGSLGSGNYVSLFVVIAALIIVPLSVLSIVMLHRKSIGGLNVVIASFLLTGSLFLLIGAFGVFSYIGGSEGSILFSLALTLLGISTLRKVSTIRNDAYVAWYQSYSRSSTGIANDTEVLTLCPQCDSILAVIPSKLSPADLCPNCRCNLVVIEEE